MTSNERIVLYLMVYITEINTIAILILIGAIVELGL